MKKTIVPRTLKQWLVIFIVIVELIMLFMPWIRISLDANGRTLDFEFLADELELDYDSLLEVAEDFAEQYCENEEAETVKFFSRRLNNILDDLRDSMISPFELASLLSNASSITGYATKEIKDYAYMSEYYDSDDREFIANFESVRISLLLVSLLSWAFLLALALTAIAAIKGTFRGDLSSVSPYLVVYCVFFGTLIISLALCNSKVETLLDELTDSSFGFFFYYSGSLLHFTATPFIGVVLALSAAFINKFMPAHLELSDSMLDAVDKVRNNGIYDHIEDIKSSVISANPLGGWECICGHRNTGTALYCENCGEKKIDRTKCESCGATLKRGSSFCSNCGAPVTWKSNELTCPSCGKKLKTGSKFCIYCGSDVESTDLELRERDIYRPSTTHEVKHDREAGRTKGWTTPELNIPPRGERHESSTGSSSSGRLKNNMGLHSK